MFWFPFLLIRLDLIGSNYEFLFRSLRNSLVQTFLICIKQLNRCVLGLSAIHDDDDKNQRHWFFSINTIFPVLRFVCWCECVRARVLKAKSNRSFFKYINRKNIQDYKNWWKRQPQKMKKIRNLKPNHRWVNSILALCHSA